MTLIKFCGMTREDDVRAACDLDVDALGFVMWRQSPRYVDARRVASLIKTMRPEVTPVGVFVSPTTDDVVAAGEAGIRIAQIHGPWNPGTVEPWMPGTLELWRATSLEGDLDALPRGVTVVLDAHDPVRHGGTGRTIDWVRAATVAAHRRVVLAGGLTPDNVSEAIRQVKPFGVDVASGVEEGPGIKNVAAMKAFVMAAREADQ